MCSIAEQTNADSDDDDTDSLHKNRASKPPNMQMEYSASRDPAKLGESTQTEGSFKVGNREHEQQIQNGIQNQQWAWESFLCLKNKIYIFQKGSRKDNQSNLDRYYK